MTNHIECMASSHAQIKSCMSTYAASLQSVKYQFNVGDIIDCNCWQVELDGSIVYRYRKALICSRSILGDCFNGYGHDPTSIGASYEALLVSFSLYENHPHYNGLEEVLSLHAEKEIIRWFGEQEIPEWDGFDDKPSLEEIERLLKFNDEIQFLSSSTRKYYASQLSQEVPETINGST